MHNAASTPTSETANTASLSVPQLVALVHSKTAVVDKLQHKITTLEHQLDWFRRQLFGQKSERFAPQPDPTQMYLGEMMALPDSPAQDKRRVVPEHTRRTAKRDAAGARDEAMPFFDESRIPVETIVATDPCVAGLSEDQYEVIGEKVTYRLAQRPGSYLVIKYLRPVIKRLDTQSISCASAPLGVIEGSRADVSFCAGMLVDKCAYHLPLYRIHQRLVDNGINVSRPWLTQLSQQIIALLEPIYDAQFDSIRAGRVMAMDETPIKAGRSEGKMKAGYFWPVYGERDEVCFPFSPTRTHDNVFKLLGLSRTEGGVLLSDGYGAYAAYAKKTGLTHAQCWAHTRRGFFDALQAEPEASGSALEQIGALYAIEKQIRERKLAGESKRLHRLTHSKPQVEVFFEWIEDQFQRQGLLPSSPLTQALAYARTRRLGLEVFLSDPDVPIDTNHLERALRAIPMGRKNWNFCWTELGAKHIGIVQSLIVTCRLHGIDPYTYLVDVLQRISQHPASRVAELTPWQWKQRFADNPLRSDLHICR